MEKITILEGKCIILGVTGSVAAYKSAILASHLTQMGADVNVVMTDAACRFIAPLTFQALTGRPVYTDMWSPPVGGDETNVHIAHVGLGEAADLMVIAPATANTLARLAHGLADNLLTLTALAARCPIMVAPAMDGAMYAADVTQENIGTLERRGLIVIGPAGGRMASGLEGRGRMVEPDEIIGHIRLVLGREGPLKDRKVVVTAGGTREPIDPVRFITNPSSGRQGYALAQAAIDMGASVVLITAPTCLTAPVGAEVIRVGSAEEMADAVEGHLADADALIMAAAVADFRPIEVAAHKLKKENLDELTLRLVRTPDILARAGELRRKVGMPRVLVGFAAESRDLLENARAKLERKGLDMIVANDITAPDAGFGAETNRVTLLYASGKIEPLKLMSKQKVAEHVMRRVADMLASLS